MWLSSGRPERCRGSSLASSWVLMPLDVSLVQLRDQLQITSGAFPHCIFVPWQAQWRFARDTENDVNTNLSRRINKIAATVAAWTERTA